MWLNCKVIKKWQPPISTSTFPFSGFSPLSSKKFCTPPLVTQFLEGPIPTFYEGARGRGGVPIMIRHLNTFRVISNEMSVLLLILSGCYFSCLKMYSDKFFNAYYFEQMFFEFFVVKGDIIAFLKNSSLNSEIFINKPPCFLEVLDLIF